MSVSRARFVFLALFTKASRGRALVPRVKPPTSCASSSLSPPAAPPSPSLSPRASRRRVLAQTRPLHVSSLGSRSTRVFYDTPTCREPRVGERGRAVPSATRVSRLSNFGVLIEAVNDAARDVCKERKTVIHDDSSPLNICISSYEAGAGVKILLGKSRRADAPLSWGERALAPLMARPPA